MANDAKLGLLAGLSAVLVIAVVYYQKLPSNANAGSLPGLKSPSVSRPASVGPETDPLLFPAKPAERKDVLLRSGGPGE